MKKIIAIAALLTPLVANAGWSNHKSVDDFTDAVSYNAVYTVNDNVKVMVDCESVMFVHNKYLNSGEKSDNIYRIDKEEVKRFIGYSEGQLSVLFKSYGSYYSELISGMKSGNKLILKSYDYKNHSHNMTVSLAGFTKVYNKLQCK